MSSSATTSDCWLRAGGARDLRRIQPEARQMMGTGDFIRGYRGAASGFWRTLVCVKNQNFAPKMDIFIDEKSSLFSPKPWRLNETWLYRKSVFRVAHSLVKRLNCLAIVRPLTTSGGCELSATIRQYALSATATSGSGH